MACFGAVSPSLGNFSSFYVFFLKLVSSPLLTSHGIDGIRPLNHHLPIEGFSCEGGRGISTLNPRGLGVEVEDHVGVPVPFSRLQGTAPATRRAASLEGGVRRVGAVLLVPCRGESAGAVRGEIVALRVEGVGSAGRAVASR